MKFKINLLIFGIFVLSLSLVSAGNFAGGDGGSFSGGVQQVGSFTNPQFYQPGFRTGGSFDISKYWKNYNKVDCKERHDFLLMIPPGGCSPSVVRSDLLEEQNVPVFCKVMSIQANPLMDVSKIRSVSFRGKMPKGIQGISYYPARAYVQSGRSLEGSPIVDNVGYLVVVLKKQETESKMPDNITGTLTAVIDYDTKNTPGVGRQEFFSGEVKDIEWKDNYQEYGFWKGRGYVRIESIGEDYVDIGIYRNFDTKIANIRLRRHETSRAINLGGDYCSTGVRLKLEDIGYPSDKALLMVDDQELWVKKGSRFLDDRCRVRRVDTSGIGGGKVSIYCSGAGKFDLMLKGSKIYLDVCKEKADGSCEMSNNQIQFQEPQEFESGKIVRRNANVFTIKESFLSKIFSGVKGVVSGFSSGKNQASEGISKNDYTLEKKDIYLAAAGRFKGSKSKYAVLIAGGEDYDMKSISSFIYQEQKNWDTLYEEKKLMHGIGVTAGIAAFGIMTGGVGFTIVGLAGAGGYNAMASSYQDSIGGKEKAFYEYILDELNKNYNINIGHMAVIYGDMSWAGVRLSKKDTGDVILEDNPDLKEYYDKAIKDYSDVVDLFPDVEMKNLGGEKTFAEKALINSVDLSKTLGLEEKQRDFLNTLIEKYPEGKGKWAKGELNKIGEYEIGEEAQAVVTINNLPHFVTLLDIKEPSYQELGAKLTFINRQNGNTETRLLVPDTEVRLSKKVSSVDVKDENGNDIKIDNIVDVELKSIKDDSVVISFNKGIVSSVKSVIKKKLGLGSSSGSVRVGLGKKVIMNEDLAVRLEEVHFKKQATVKLIPEIRGTRSYANFSFGVGIEKRAIKLSPEKTMEMMEKLKRQMDKWNDVNKKLGKVVKAMKGACFATSAALTVKNWFAGMTGESMARHEIMTSPGGWNDKCKKIASEKGISVDKCLMNHASEIKRDVELRKKSIEETNQIIKKIQGEVKPVDTGILGNSYNEKDIENKYRREVFNNWYNSHKNDEITLKDGTKKALSKIVPQNDLGDLSLEEMKELVSYSELSQGSDVLKDISKKRVGNILSNVDSRLKYKNDVDGLKSAFKNIGVSAIRNPEGKEVIQQMDSIKGRNVKIGNSNLGESTQSFLMVVPNGEKITTIKDGQKTIQDSPIAGQKIIIGLKKYGDSYQIEKALNSNGEDVTSAVQKYYADKGISSFKKVDSGSYHNRIKGDVKCEFFQRAPYNGLPALIPFDYTNGWYVATEYIVSGFGKPFESSGRAVNFWICNVGENGMIDFKRGDICRYYNLGSPAEFSFPGLSKSESNRLVRNAENALRSASIQYAKGNKEYINIGGRRCKTGISSRAESGRCTDFMSPEDCLLMFNVCDPVICPTSRCDLGGKYPVADVVQSGIVGSLLLCLPNVKEGIAVPICLTGVHAGIDAFVSILNSTYQCLNESLETGKHIGICDEIESIYLCEFFWKQIVPLMDIIIPRMFESLMGQGARGGGEYLTVQKAWDNMQASINYFKNDYAVNSMKAFNMRSTEEAGSFVCKSFMSASYPSSAKFFENLVEPDSPVQYSGWFSEDKMTDATIPPMSHYKVYFHIYAGKDIGANYLVYLKNPADAGLINVANTYVVDRGYIKRGSQVDKAKDFTAVSGYQKMCISVNGQESCDFGQVSTSFAINYLNDLYIKEQSSDNKITKSSECVAGTPSGYSLLQPNLQAGVEEAIHPEVYKRGVIRVCSSKNPGRETPEQTNDRASKNDRWKKVGYCDDPSIGCWIDTESVKANLAQNKELLKQSLKDIDKSHLKEAIEVANKKIGDVNKIFKEAEKLQKSEPGTKSDVFDKLELISEFGGSNYNKAKALFLRGRIYDVWARKTYSRILKKMQRGVEESVKKVSGEKEGDVKIDNKNDKVAIESSKKIADDLENVNELKERIEKVSDKNERAKIEKQIEKTKKNLKETEEKTLKLTSNIEIRTYVPSSDSSDNIEEYYIYDYSKGWSGSGVDESFKNIGYLEGLNKIIEYIIENDGQLYIDRQKIDISSKNKTKILTQVLKVLSKSNANDVISEYNSYFDNHWTLENAKKYINRRFIMEDWNKDTPAYRKKEPFVNPIENTYIFVDQLHNSGVLTDDEYREINGKGLFNLEENMGYVKDLLEKKSEKVVDSKKNIVSNYPEHPIGSSILMFNNKDFLDCPEAVQRAKDKGSIAVNFIPTLYAYVDNKNNVKSYYLKVIKNNKDTYVLINNVIIQQLNSDLKNCMQKAYNLKLKISYTPHLDSTPKSEGVSWRNSYKFNPINKLNGFSYKDILLEPGANALLNLPQNVRADFSMQGEMGGTLFDYPNEWKNLVLEYKGEFSSSGHNNIRVGINTNGNKLTGEDDDSGDDKWFDSKFNHNKDNFQNLINSIDFLGFSEYYSVSKNPSKDDFLLSLSKYKNLFSKNGINLPESLPIRFSEVGIGGGINGKECSNGYYINSCTYQGPLDNPDALICKGNENPWDNSKPKNINLRRKFYSALINAMKTGSIDSAYLWNLGTWDPQGIYRDNQNCADDTIVSLIRDYNFGGNKNNGVNGILDDPGNPQSTVEVNVPPQNKGSKNSPLKIKNIKEFCDKNSPICPFETFSIFGEEGKQYKFENSGSTLKLMDYDGILGFFKKNSGGLYLKVKDDFKREVELKLESDSKDVPKTLNLKSGDILWIDIDKDYEIDYLKKRNKGVFGNNNKVPSKSPSFLYVSNGKIKEIIPGKINEDVDISIKDIKKEI